MKKVENCQGCRYDRSGSCYLQTIGEQLQFDEVGYCNFYEMEEEDESSASV